MSSTTATSPTSQNNSSQTLDQADFLNLLVTQMTSQDPLNPQSDTAFAAQLAQFSALQTSQDMESDMENIQATGMIGETVSATPSTGGNPITGVVTSVQVSAGTPQIMINGETYDLSQITGVAPTPITTTPTSN